MATIQVDQLEVVGQGAAGNCCTTTITFTLTGQGYTQDTNDYYIWYTTHFSTHQTSFIFTTTSNQTLRQTSSLQIILGSTAGIAALALIASVAIRIKTKDKRGSTETKNPVTLDRQRLVG